MALPILQEVTVHWVVISCDPMDCPVQDRSCSWPPNEKPSRSQQRRRQRKNSRANRAAARSASAAPAAPAIRVLQLEQLLMLPPVTMAQPRPEMSPVPLISQIPLLPITSSPPIAPSATAGLPEPQPMPSAPARPRETRRRSRPRSDRAQGLPVPSGRAWRGRRSIPEGEKTEEEVMDWTRAILQPLGSRSFYLFSRNGSLGGSPYFNADCATVALGV